MTCIVAIREEGKIVIAGDSAACSDEGLIEVRQDPKVFECDDYLIGYTTSFRMGQILHHNTALPKPETKKDGFAFMVREFIPAVQRAFEEHKFAKTLSRGETLDTGHWGETGQAWAGKFIVGFHGQVFVIYSDYQVAMPELPYAAIGSGAKVAYGALHATQTLPLVERAEVALRAASEHCSCVKSPFKIVMNPP